MQRMPNRAIEDQTIEGMAIKILKNTNTLRWLSGCLIFLVACSSCGISNKDDILAKAKSDSIWISAKNERAIASIAAAKKTIRSGDLIVHTGNDFTSSTLRNLCQHDRTYSHCGIASIEHDSVFVYHALGGEWNPDQKLRRDPFELFATPIDNVGTGIYRFPLSAQQQAGLSATVKRFYHIGIMFDMKFNLADNDRMYCAEFVSKAYTLGTKGALKFNTSALGTFRYVGVDDIFLHPQCAPILKLLYK